MNSTCSFQPRCANSTTVEPAPCFKSKVNSVPIHSGAPSTHCHLTSLPGTSSMTFISLIPRSPNRNLATAPTTGEAVTLLDHQPARPFSFVSAAKTLSVDDLIPTRCNISGILITPDLGWRDMKFHDGTHDCRIRHNCLGRAYS